MKSSDQNTIRMAIFQIQKLQCSLLNTGTIQLIKGGMLSLWVAAVQFPSKHAGGLWSDEPSHLFPAGANSET
jgi:hypothetical protein